MGVRLEVDVGMGMGVVSEKWRDNNDWSALRKRVGAIGLNLCSKEEKRRKTR